MVASLNAYGEVRHFGAVTCRIHLQLFWWKKLRNHLWPFFPELGQFAVLAFGNFVNFFAISLQFWLRVYSLLWLAGGSHISVLHTHYSCRQQFTYIHIWTTVL